MDRIKGLELQLARALDSQVDTNLQRSISQNYERARRKCIYLEDLVSKLKQEVQHLKNVAASTSKQLATDSPNVIFSIYVFDLFQQSTSIQNVTF